MIEVLKLENVSKWFTGLHALTDITINFRQGERVSIIGPNGAGKTTLFNVISGEKSATAGRVKLFNKDVTRKPIRARVALGIRRTYQDTSVFDNITVGQNIFLSLRGLEKYNFNLFSDSNKSISRDTFIKKIAEKIILLDKIDTIVGDLSHGEKRQLEIGLAIAHMPQILLLDEPAAGLSLIERKKVIELLKKLPKKVTVLLIEHDMEVALSVAERLIVLNEGKVLVTGRPEEVIANKMVQDIYLGGKLDE